MGREELIDDPRFATGATRFVREAEVDAIITEWARQHTKEEAMELVSGVGVPAGAVFDTMELQKNPTFEERGIMQVMERPNGKFKMPAWPVRVERVADIAALAATRDCRHVEPYRSFSCSRALGTRWSASRRRSRRSTYRK